MYNNIGIKTILRGFIRFISLNFSELKTKPRNPHKYENLRAFKILIITYLTGIKAKFGYLLGLILQRFDMVFALIFRYLDA